MKIFRPYLNREANNLKTKWRSGSVPAFYVGLGVMGSGRGTGNRLLWDAMRVMSRYIYLFLLCRSLEKIVGKYNNLSVS